MTLYFTGTEKEIIEAAAKINGNCGLPFGSTIDWSTPTASYSDPNFWFILMPWKDGWTREDGTYFTQEKMIEGVMNIAIEERQNAWFPPERINFIGDRDGHKTN